MKKYHRNDKVLSAELDQEICLFDEEEGQYYNLNNTSSSIWNLLETPLNLEELTDYLKEEYLVNTETCKEEVLDHLRELIDLKIIKYF